MQTQGHGRTRGVCQCSRPTLPFPHDVFLSVLPSWACLWPEGQSGVLKARAEFPACIFLAFQVCGRLTPTPSSGSVHLPALVRSIRLPRLGPCPPQACPSQETTTHPAVQARDLGALDSPSRKSGLRTVCPVPKSMTPAGAKGRRRWRLLSKRGANSPFVCLLVPVTMDDRSPWCRDPLYSVSWSKRRLS